MTTRDRLVAVVVVAVMLLAGLWFLLVAPQHSKASSLETQITTAQAALETAQAQVATNRVAEIAYKKDFATIASLGKATPSDPALASLLVQLQGASSSAHVQFLSIDKGASTSNATPTPPAPTSTTTSTTAATTATTPAATSSSTTGTSTATDASASSGLTTIPFQFTFQGTYFQLAKLMQTIQGFTTVRNDTIKVKGRLIVINSIAYAAAPSGFPNILATISANAFQVPKAAVTTTDATSTATGTTAAASNTATGSSATPAATASVGSTG